MYAFDHDEAIRACTRAIEADRRYTARAADRARDRCRHPDQIAVPVSAGGLARRRRWSALIRSSPLL